MRTLWLLRHAKASGSERGRSDHDRPLEARGADDAERMGRHLAARGFAPQRTVCSTAIRARETLEHLVRGLGGDLPSALDRDLYLASGAEIATLVRRVPDDVTSLLLVGHNPGMAELAAGLARGGDPECLAALRAKFPTCALAELRFDTERWRQLSGGGELVSYRTPKSIREEDR